jgi:hypothetical protein
MVFKRIAMKKIVFKDCTIIVKSKTDKKEFLRACKHIHDFSVFWDKNRKITEAWDEWGRAWVSVSKKGKISHRKTIGKCREILKRDCGLSLNFNDYPFVNFLASLYDCDDPKTGRDPFLIIQEPKRKKCKSITK